MKTYPLSALLGRMKYITRWSLMRNGRPETLSEHTADTALLAHMLCLIGRNCTGTGGGLRPEVVATAALYHDAPEILTGDMPTPIKYRSEALRSLYKEVEDAAEEELVRRAPEKLQPIYHDLFTMEADRELLPYVKAADKLSAYIKCLQETQAGNREFSHALACQEKSLKEMSLPEVKFFFENCIPAFSQSLDEQQQFQGL